MLIYIYPRKCSILDTECKPMIQYYDSHTHLNDENLFQDRKDLLQRFRDLGGKWLVNVWANHEFNKRWLAIAKDTIWYTSSANNMFVWATIWFHPYEVVAGHITQNNIQEQIDQLEQQYLTNREYICAIGECGIDTHYDGEDDISLQQQLFQMQCDMARKYDLPLIIHSRDAFTPTRDVIKNYKDIKIYFHCRGYDEVEIKQLESFFPQLRIGFCGNITYAKAENLRRSLQAVDMTHMVLETDAPYLSPQVVRWQKNQPANIKYIYDFVAKYLNLGGEDLAIIIEKNFERLYYTPTL